MKEYLTEAVVLNLKSSRNDNRTADLYTKELGRIEARVIGGRKIVSKLSPHLDIGNLVEVRLAHKGGFTVTDVLQKIRPVKRVLLNRSAGLELIFLLRALLPIAFPDPSLWHNLKRAIEKNALNFAVFLKVLGYDPKGAYCRECRIRSVSVFDFEENLFFCERCAKDSLNKSLIFIGKN